MSVELELALKRGNQDAKLQKQRGSWRNGRLEGGKGVRDSGGKCLMNRGQRKRSRK